MNRKTVYEISKSEPREVEITHMRPEGSTAPKTLAWVQYLPGQGMDVTMRCYETRPRAIYWDPMVQSIPIAAWNSISTVSRSFLKKAI